jgi:hypothetical protein
VSTSKNIETPDSSDGNGLAEKLLGLDGFRVIEVTETPEELVIRVETVTTLVGCDGCGTRAESQDRVEVANSGSAVLWSPGTAGVVEAALAVPGAAA